MQRHLQRTERGHRLQSILLALNYFLVKKILRQLQIILQLIFYIILTLLYETTSPQAYKNSNFLETFIIVTQQIYLLRQFKYGFKKIRRK